MQSRLENSHASDDALLKTALTSLQATASQFTASCINDLRVRLQYARDIAAMAEEFRTAVQTGQLSVHHAAEQASAVRNRLMELSRLKSSPTDRAYAARLKRNGRSFAELELKYAQPLYGESFAVLSEGRRATVYAETIRGAGRPDPGVMRLAQQIGKAGQRVLLVSLAIAVYEIAKSDDWPREMARQGAISGAGIFGGWMTGTAALATGVCAATAPVCVTAAALVGGMLVAYGADLGFTGFYPRSSR